MLCIVEDGCYLGKWSERMEKYLLSVTAAMKRLSALILLLCPMFLYAHGVTLYDHAQIKELSSFCIMGVIELRTEKDVSAAPAYRTLNHEGGMKVAVLEIMKADVYESRHGLWLYVILTSPLWADNGEWIEKSRKFLIFLPDDMPVYNFEA